MPLTPPDTSELLFHTRQTTPYTSQEALYAEDSLQRATDLMEMATGVHEDPEDELAYRVMQTGILSMAWAINVLSEDAESFFSPFSSERLGSYSYSKMQQAVEDKGLTGVPAFDQAVKYFQGLDQAAGGDSAAFGVTAEQVWDQPYPKSEQAGETLRDPVAPLATDAWSR